jgi:NAD(P)-dependent dehydrogenase (short-subunit alcohol dehydrogenase family)
MSVALITGCSTGIGLETALALATRGDTVVASMRSPAKSGLLVERAKAAGANVDIVTLDVTDDQSVTSAVAEVEQRHGGIDILVNNAGVGHSGPIETIDIDRARELMETNLWGAVRTIRAALPKMRERGSGVIINVTSVAGRVPGNGYNGFYSASKHGLGALSEALAWEVAAFGIRVACIEPGFFSTEIFANSDWGEVDATTPYGADNAWMSDFYIKSGQVAGADPRIVAEAILRVTDDPAAPLHTLVGDDATLFVDLVGQAGTFENWVPVGTQIVESVAGPRPVQPLVGPV